MAVDAIGSYDDDELRTRAMQGIGGVSFTPLAGTIAPPGLSPISSISEAPEKEPVPQHRPTLAPPRHIMIDIIGSHMETERLAGKNVRMFDAEVAKNLTDIDKLSVEKQEAIESEAKAAKARTTWTALSLIAQYVSSVGLIILGTALGGVPAALLVGAGVIGIGNRILHDTNLLQVAVEWYTKSEELQKKITHNIEMGAFFLQMGLGLAGGFAAWHAGAFAGLQAANTLAVTQKTTSIISAASGLMNAGSQVGIAIYNKRIADLQARMKEINMGITTDHQTMYQDSNRVNRMIESYQMETEVMQKAIRNLEVSQD